MEALKFTEITLHMRVMDTDGDVGEVSGIENEHNVWVDLYWGGRGQYCLDPNCSEYDPLYPYDNSEVRGIQFERDLLN
jgi:hypothetical protein